MREVVPTAYLDEAEVAVLHEALEALRGRDDDVGFLHGVLDRLGRLGEVVTDFPSLYAAEKMAGRYRGPETLVAHLVKRGPLAAPLGLPVRAALARDFVLAKVQTFRAVLLTLRAAGADPALCERVSHEEAQSIYSVLADQLLVDLIVDAGVASETKHRGAQLLVDVWERCIELEIDDFCPLLESAWRARNRLVVSYGTLIGGVEIVRLGAEGDPAVAEALLDGDDTEERQLAFEEFLFGLSHEHLGTVRRVMAEQGLAAVDRAWVAETLGIAEAELFSGITDPEAMFAAYQKRQLGASYRRLRGVPGPKRTAEAFLMLHILEAP
ncbi:MAG: hypothetical protein QNK03_01330 [Myxococcota bacterium]|nr:hypothetical protein [Myxococcota bacterium]